MTCPGWVPADVTRLRYAISKTYISRDDALLFLQQAGFQYFPDFRNSGTFWYEVFTAAEHGAIGDYGHRFLDIFEKSFPFHPAVAELRWRHQECAAATVRAEPGHARERELSPSVRERYRAALGAAALAASCDLALTRWTEAELAALHDRLEAWQFRLASADTVVGRAIDLLRALRATLDVMPVLEDMGVSMIKIDYLRHIYWRTVSRFPAGTTLESMAIEAAGVSIAETRLRHEVSLTALTRFALGIASHSGVDVAHPGLVDWLRAQHHQVADAQEYLLSMVRPAWLLVDCGDEPRREPGRVTNALLAGRVRLTGVLQTVDGVRRLEQESADGLESALRSLLDQARAERRLVVDLAVPHALMSAGLEHLPVVSGSEGYEPLTASCQPRLRWSLRLHHAVRYEWSSRGGRRTASWRRLPRLLDAEVVTDREALRRWLRDNRNHDLPYLIGGAGVNAAFDPILMLLRDGKEFIIWFTGGADAAAARRITRAARRLPPASRRFSLPEQIDVVDRRNAAIIWDDPDGREGFPLPSLLPGFDR